MSSIQWGQLLKDAASVPGFEPVPAGDYLCQVIKVETTTTSRSEVMFKYQAKIQSGPHKDRVLFSNIVVPGPGAKDPSKNGQRFQFLIRDLKNFGITQEFLNAQPEPSQIESELMHKFAMLKIKQVVYDGDLKNEVDRIKKAPAGAGAGPAAGGIAPPPPAAAPAPPVQYTPQPVPAPAPAAPAPAPAPAEAPAPAAAPAAPPVAPAEAPAPPAAAPQEAPVAPAPQPTDAPVLPPSPFGAAAQ